MVLLCKTLSCGKEGEEKLPPLGSIPPARTLEPAKDSARWIQEEGRGVAPDDQRRERVRCESICDGEPDLFSDQEILEFFRITDIRTESDNLERVSFPLFGEAI
jgi:hypothetical protein